MAANHEGSRSDKPQGEGQELQGEFSRQQLGRNAAEKRKQVHGPTYKLKIN